MQPEIDIEAVAGRMRTARRLAGMTKREAAIQLDVTEKTISRWEDCETEAFIGRLDQIARIYGTTAAAILGDDATTAQLAAIRSELEELRALMSDPKRLRARADSLMDDEGAKPKKKRR